MSALLCFLELSRNLHSIHGKIELATLLDNYLWYSVQARGILQELHQTTGTTPTQWFVWPIEGDARQTLLCRPGKYQTLCRHAYLYDGRVSKRQHHVWFFRSAWFFFVLIGAVVHGGRCARKQAPQNTCTCAQIQQTYQHRFHRQMAWTDVGMSTTLLLFRYQLF